MTAAVNAEMAAAEIISVLVSVFPDVSELSKFSEVLFRLLDPFVALV